MGCDFNLHEDEWAKEDNTVLQTMLTSEEIKIEQLEKENKDLREKVHFWKKEVNVAHRSRSDEIDNLNARVNYYKRELADANEKLVNTGCQYERCFNHLKKVVKVLKNVYDPMQPACLEEVEQFIKENE